MPDVLIVPTCKSVRLKAIIHAAVHEWAAEIDRRTPILRGETSGDLRVSLASAQFGALAEPQRAPRT